MDSKDENREQELTLELNWKVGNPIIAKANSFGFVYNAMTIILMVGFFEPSDLRLPQQKLRERKYVDVNTLSRFALDIEDFKRLKEEVDKVYKELKTKGVYSDDK